MRGRLIFIVCIFAFLVSWQVSEWVIEPCPWTKIVNPYTGRTGGDTACAVNHGHYNTYQMTKTFQTREEADKFIESAPSNTSDFVIEEIAHDSR